MWKFDNVVVLVDCHENEVMVAWRIEKWGIVKWKTSGAGGFLQMDFHCLVGFEPRGRVCIWVSPYYALFNFKEDLFRKSIFGS